MFTKIDNEYLVEEISTSARYVVIPVWDSINEDWSGEAWIMLVKNGVTLRRDARLVGMGELADIFPANEYTVLDCGVHVEV
jgi:hypothetical protein